MAEALFDDLVADSHQRVLPALTRRSIVLPWVAGKADAIVGMRRVGKTWLRFQKMAELVSSGTPRADLLYINFEDERLGDVSARDLGRIIEAHFRANPAARERHGAFFFDEIHLVGGWERFVRRLIDTEAAHVSVTGSSAKL